MIQEANFTWGDVVLIKESAPLNYRPGFKGCVCGIQVSFEFDNELKSELYLIEFGDGEALEIPKILLSKVSDEPHINTDPSIT